MTKSADVVNQYMAAMAGGPKAAQTMVELLAEDFQFDGPMLKAGSRDKFLEGMAGMGEMQPKFTMLKQIEAGQDVCSVYEFRLREDGPAVVMSEWAVVRDGQIASQRLVYNAVDMQAAMGEGAA